MSVLPIIRGALLCLLCAPGAFGRCHLSFRHPGCSLSCVLGLGRRCRGGMHHPPSKTTPPTKWTMVRLSDDGDASHWDTVSFPLTTGGEIGRMTDRLPCEGVWLRWTAGSYDYKWHNA